MIKTSYECTAFNQGEEMTQKIKPIEDAEKLLGRRIRYHTTDDLVVKNLMLAKLSGNKKFVERAILIADGLRIIEGKK